LEEAKVQKQSEQKKTSIGKEEKKKTQAQKNKKEEKPSVGEDKKTQKTRARGERKEALRKKCTTFGRGVNKRGRSPRL